MLIGNRADDLRACREIGHCGGHEKSHKFGLAIGFAIENSMKPIKVIHIFTILD